MGGCRANLEEEMENVGREVIVILMTTLLPAGEGGIMKSGGGADCQWSRFVLNCVSAAMGANGGVPACA